MPKDLGSPTTPRMSHKGLTPLGHPHPLGEELQLADSDTNRLAEPERSAQGAGLAARHLERRTVLV